MWLTGVADVRPFQAPPPVADQALATVDRFVVFLSKEAVF